MSASSATDMTSQLSCPVPFPAGARVLLAHGEGARLTRALIRHELLQAFDNPLLRPLTDSALLPEMPGRLAVSTDGYVVSPLFFPGGDIGKLAVHGTVNDLAMSGAEPLYLCLGLIVEEGLPIEVLQRVVNSVRDAALACGIEVVAGDTKVVPRGAADQLFVTTTGIGRVPDGVDLGAHRVQASDKILVSGTIGDHGIAVLSAREGLELESSLMSDTAPLHSLVRSLLTAGVDVHFLRDPTRGGVSAVLHELSEATQCTAVIEEDNLPVNDAVRGACEILGLDPLYVANEGKLIAVVAGADADRALELLRTHPRGKQAAIIGEVRNYANAPVLVRGSLGTLRILDDPSGAPLPRIC